MVKGLLVIAMLIIHASGLFVDSESLRRFIYPTCLGFVSGSWLFTSGYLIGVLNRIGFDETAAATTRRVVGRGLRLVAIFIASNFALGRLPFAFDNSAASNIGSLAQGFIFGDDRLAFEVLLGIGYLLIVSPALLCLRPLASVFVCVGLILAAAVSSAFGWEWTLIPWMLCSGIAGLTVGSLMAPGGIERFMDNGRNRLIVVVLAFATWGITTFAAASSAWPLTWPIVYVPHIAGALLLLYVLGRQIRKLPVLRRPLALMAHYSLLAYMGQMAVLQAWHQVSLRWSAAGAFPFAFTASLLILLLGLYSLAGLRRRMPLVDRAYRAIFGQ